MGCFLNKGGELSNEISRLFITFIKTGLQKSELLISSIWLQVASNWLNARYCY